MKLQSMVHPLTPEFSFAGFDFPKWLWSLPRGSFAQRLARAKNPVCGPYYHAPKPNTGGKGFYLASDGMPSLRWNYCDEVTAWINHKGWYCDEFQDQTIRGIVFYLPRSRGCLAGWTMGERMASEIDYTIHETESDAAQAANELARIAAENEHEYQEKERVKEQEAEEQSLRETAEELE